MKFTVYNDVHLLSTYSHEALLPFDRDAILNGDIVDLQNCLYKDIGYALDLIKLFKKKYGDRYILGNHELEAIACAGFYKSNGVLFRHGDHEFWGKEKREAYLANATPGAGWLKRNVIARASDWFRRIYTSRYSNEFLQRASSIAIKHECHTIVFGHKHPLKRVDFIHNNIKIIVLPRGKNIINIGEI